MKKKPTQKLRLATHAKHLLIPHKGNNWRPHLIRRHSLLLVAALIIAIQVVYSLAHNGRLEVLGRTSSIAVSELLADTNTERAKAELPALTINDKLDEAAYLKAKDMFAHNYWAHESPSGVTPWKWFGDVNYAYDVAGENLAKNYPDADATVAAWMASPTHKANVLNAAYTDVGFATLEDTLDGRETTIVVAMYGRPVSAGVAGTTTDKKMYAPLTQGAWVNPFAYIGSAIQSLSPATIGVLAILVLVGIVGVITQHYRNKLPKELRKSWKAHHGAYTAVGVVAMIVLIVLSTGGGQI